MGEYADKAKQNFFDGYNCCQAVACAFAPRFGVDEKTAAKLVEGLGAGMGRMRLTCGAVSGMAVVAGMAKSHGEGGDLARRGEIYALVQQMADEFKKINGSIICAELLGASLPKDNSPTPSARTREYYKKRPCAECIYCAAAIVEKYLLT